MKINTLSLVLLFVVQFSLARPVSSLNDDHNEVIYLKTDRDVYELNERIWFSTIHLGSKTLTPKYNSSVLYFLLLDKEKKIIDRRKFPIQKGTTNGSYLIPNDLEEGIYYILTYTKNSLDNLLFVESTKPIMVYRILPKKMYIEYDTELTQDGKLNLQIKFHKKNKSSIDKAKVKLSFWNRDKEEEELNFRLRNSPSLNAVIEHPKKANLNYIKVAYKDSNNREKFFIHLPNLEDNQIEFHPEGNFLQYGQEQFIGYKVKSRYAMPEFLYLYENDLFLKKVKVHKNGIGKFELLLKKNNNYHVTTKREGDKFPISSNNIAKAVRISLNKDPQTSQNLVKVFPNSNYQKQHIYLKVFSKGKLVDAKNIWIRNKTITAPLTLNNVTPGVFLVCAYDAKGTLLSYRFGFLNSDSSIELAALKKTKVTYKSGEKVKLSLSSKFNGLPVKVRYSTSIFKKTLNNTSFDKDLLLHYLLDSEFISPLKDIPLENNNTNINDLLLTMSLEDYRWNPENTFPKVPHPSEAIQIKAIQKAYKQDIAPAASMPFLVKCNNGIYSYVSNKLGVFNIDKMTLSDKKCYLLPPQPSFNMKVLIEVKDLIKNLDTIIPSLKKFDPTQYITFSKASKPFIDEVGFSFSATNQLDDIDIRRKPRDPYENVEDYDISPLDFVCMYNILNCTNHLGDPSNKKPVLGEKYSFREYGDDIVTVTYIPNKKQYPPEIFTIEKQQYFAKKNHNHFDAHHNTSLWSPFKTSIKTGKIDLQLIAPETRGTYIAVIEAYDHKGNLGSHQIEFTVK
jgi:hypothetical protein